MTTSPFECFAIQARSSETVVHNADCRRMMELDFRHLPDRFDGASSRKQHYHLCS